jgi:hypothetical protein
MLLLILQSLSKWLEIKVVRAHWDLMREIETYSDAIENAILEARAANNDALADRLRARLARSAGVAVPSLGSVATDARTDVPGAGK